MTTPHLNGHHRRTLAGLFRHPASHNIEWHDVLSLLKHIGTVTKRHNGDFDVAVGDNAIIVDRPKGHDLEADQLRSLTHLLASAGLSPDDVAPWAPASAPVAGDEATCIVLIDHHQAKIFERCRQHEAAEATIVLKPADEDGSRQRVTHRQGSDDVDSGHAPEEAAYYESIGADLGGASRIVILSDGEGCSNASDHLVAYLKRHHGRIALRIAARGRIDSTRLSDGEIVAAGLALVEA